MQVAFDDDTLKSSLFITINWIIDFFFFIDIIICFRTVYIDNHGREVSDDIPMAIQYIKTSFIIDVIATVPFDDLLSLIDAY